MGQPADWVPGLGGSTDLAAADRSYGALMTTDNVTTHPHETVWSITNAGVPASCLHLVAELGVADRLDGPAEVADLAERCSAEPAALDRVLRLLVSHGVFTRQGTVYAHNDASALLRSDHPASMRAFARMMGLPVIGRTFAALHRSVADGSPAIESVSPGGLWAHLRSHPDEAAIFNSAMQAKAQADIGAVVSAYDFQPFTTVADVAGGLGHLLRAILDAATDARGILFEVPGVVDSLPDPGPRLSYHRGDFFADRLPRADCYVLMEVIHDWPDEAAIAILRGIRGAASPGATVLIVEGIRDPAVDDPREATLDVIMLAVTGGRERTPAELGDLLKAAGFRSTALIETAGAMKVLEAVAV